MATLLQKTMQLQTVARMTKYKHTNQKWETADVRHEEPSTCPVTGKRRYPNEREATSTAAHQISQQDTAPVHLRTYKCLYCGSWHLTSKGPR